MFYAEKTTPAARPSAELEAAALELTIMMMEYTLKNEQLSTEERRALEWAHGNALKNRATARGNHYLD